VFENHRIVFTVGTSVASVLTAWAGTLFCLFPFPQLRALAVQQLFWVPVSVIVRRVMCGGSA
jgi:hypothetical protein